jgi:hypothetical protein
MQLYLAYIKKNYKLVEFFKNGPEMVRLNTKT